MAPSDGGPPQGGFEEPEEGEEAPDDGLRADERAIGGWVPPEAREWRHPSETGPFAARPPYAAGPVLRTNPSGRRTVWATGLVGAGAVAALVAGGLMLSARSRPTLSATPVTVSTPSSAVAESIVRLEVVSQNAIAYGCGLVVDQGGVVATNATLLDDARQVFATTASGHREAATVVAVDPASDVGVLRIPDSLPTAQLADWTSVQPGAGAVEMAYASIAARKPTTVWWSQTISSPDVPVSSGPASGIVSLVASTPSGVSPDGAVLMDRDGAVVGLLDPSSVSASGDSVFLPSVFVLQVAQELVAGGEPLHHGWLGIHGTATTDHHGKGVLVTEVDAAGASSGHLKAGDVIEAIDGRPVTSMADLRTRLFMLSSGSWVDLRVQRGGAVHTVGLQLGTTS